MKRSALLFTAAAMTIVISISGCSKSEQTNAASDRPPTVGTGGAGANLSDDEFVRDVALKHMAAVELGRLGLQKAMGQDVKAFAQRVVDEQGAASTALKTAASGHAADWPGQLDEKHRKPLDELTDTNGADFDRDYVKAMIDIHQNLAAKLESRLDVQSLADWKTAAAGRSDSKALPEPSTAMRDVNVRPNQSDNASTMKINQWAAATYPVAQKHLDMARALEAAAKKRSTN